MTPRSSRTGLVAFAPLVITLASGCAANVDGDAHDRCALDGTTCGERPTAQIATLEPRTPSETTGAYGAPPPPRPSRRACPNAYQNAECRWPGEPRDIRDASPCCGSVTEDARCCAARGQACSNELGLTCCNGLKCGASCTCE